MDMANRDGQPSGGGLQFLDNLSFTFDFEVFQIRLVSS